MNRSQKENFVKEFTKNVNECQALAVLSFDKVTVEKMTSFRLALRKKDIRVKVVKNTLAKKVLGGTPYKDINPHFKGPTLVCYSSGDPVAATKSIWEWVGQEGFNVTAKGGIALGKCVTGAELTQLSKLPGRNELLVSFLWALKCHPTRFLYGLTATPRNLGYALVALREKKASESSS